jgi:DNA-binding MarR family transcriptional regulator
MTTAAPENRTDSSSEALLRSVSAFSRALREAALGLTRDLGCSRGALSIVRILEAHGTVQVGDIAHLMRVDLSVASRQVSQLVDEGLVERAVDDDDRRVRTIRLSPAGRRLALDLRVHLTSHIDELFTDWSDADVTAASDVLDRLAATITAPQRELTPA